MSGVTAKALQSTSANRLTFRDKAGGICWQKQLRDKYLDEGAPNVDLSLKTAIVRRVSRKLAEQVILKYEWLGTMAPGTNYFYGLFFGSYCAGVVCFGVGSGGANINAHMPFKIEREKFAYLARGANAHWSPNGANSKLVSWACKLLHKTTGVKLVIAYSDTDAGEIGTIYQACNWDYIGLGTRNKQWIAPNGRVYDWKHQRNLARSRNTTGVKVAEVLRGKGWSQQLSSPKHRYVYILDKKDKALVDRVERMRQPYPKRAGD